MSWNNIISADILLDVARRGGYMEQLPLIETEPEFTIKEEYLSDVPVKYEWIDNRGSSGGTISSVDHPTFAALRKSLDYQGYIKMETGWINGDRVLKSFILNKYRYEIGDQFSCAAATGGHIKWVNERRENNE